MSEHTKTIFWLIAYGVLLFLAFSRLDMVLAALRTFVSFLNPVLFGVAFAFLLNLLLSRMEEKWLAALWKRAPRLGKHRRSLCIALTLPLAALTLWALGGFILPQVASSAASLANVIPICAKITAEYLNGLWVLRALIVGGNMFGLMGMVLGIPAFAVAFSLLQESLDHRLGKEDGNGEG